MTFESRECPTRARSTWAAGRHVATVEPKGAVSSRSGTPSPIRWLVLSDFSVQETLSVAWSLDIQVYSGWAHQSLSLPQAPPPLHLHPPLCSSRPMPCLSPRPSGVVGIGPACPPSLPRWAPPCPRPHMTERGRNIVHPDLMRPRSDSSTLDDI